MPLDITEIRQYGASSIQVMRRLRSMLHELQEAVLPENPGAAGEKLARLDATVVQRWGGSVDLDRASMAGGQEIGGSTTRKSGGGR